MNQAKNIFCFVLFFVLLSLTKLVAVLSTLSIDVGDILIWTRLHVCLLDA